LDEPDDIIKPNNILSGHKGWVLDMKILEGYLYTGSDDKTIMIWDLERSKSNFKFC
jgi:WD40 repeat protein